MPSLAQPKIEVSSVKVLKTESSAALVNHQLLWFLQMPLHRRPQTICRHSDTQYSYTRVDGAAGSDPLVPLTQFVLNTAYDEICCHSQAGVLPDWTPLEKHDRRIFLDYCRQVCGQHTDSMSILKRLHKQDPLVQPNPRCHGDFTIENILYTKEGKLVYIDPSFSRGWPCRLVDEGKLLQSLVTRWEEMRGVANPPPRVLKPPFEITLAHVAMLDLHWRRLVRHSSRHDRAIIAHGKKNIIPKLERICKEGLKDGLYPGTVLPSGYRRLLDRLQESCIQDLPGGLRPISASVF